MLTNSVLYTLQFILSDPLMVVHCDLGLYTRLCFSKSFSQGKDWESGHWAIWSFRGEGEDL